MSFISNASNFTLGEGVYNNIHGNLVNITVHRRKRHREEIEDGAELLALAEPLRKRRRREDGIKVIRKKHLKVTGEIGSGPGYLLHFGETKHKAIIVKAFNTGPTVREQLESTVALSKGLIHPNVLRIEGVSSRAESTQFIIYEQAYWKMAEGPLATALKEDLTRSITLGFKMIAGLSSGMNYLGLQGISLASLGAENFDIFLDIDDRFLISINPRISSETEVAEDQEPEDNLNTSWIVFNAVCQKVLKSANLALHNENIERDPVNLEPQASVSQHPLGPSVPVSAPAVESSSAQIISDSAEISSVPPRREYVWRTIDRGQRSLATVARRIALEIDMKLTSSVNKLAWSDSRSAHRCAGYVREEITLATTSVDSAVVSHDAPSPLEICSICREVVGFHEQFRCICGVLDPGSRPTVKCVACKFWSHSDCVGNPKEFTCELCLPPPGVSSPINSLAMEEEQIRRLHEAKADSDDHSWHSDSVEHYSYAQEPPSHGKPTKQYKAIRTLSASTDSSTSELKLWSPSFDSSVIDDEYSTEALPEITFPTAERTTSAIDDEYSTEVFPAITFDLTAEPSSVDIYIPPQSRQHMISSPGLLSPGWSHAGGSEASSVRSSMSSSGNSPHISSEDSLSLAAAYPNQLWHGDAFHGRSMLRRAAKNRRKDQTIPGAFVCEICGADFTAKHNLRNHMNSHEFAKEFRCDICGQCFATSHVLKRHEGKCANSSSRKDSDQMMPSDALRGRSMPRRALNEDGTQITAQDASDLLQRISGTFEVADEEGALFLSRKSEATPSGPSVVTLLPPFEETIGSISPGGVHSEHDDSGRGGGSQRSGASPPWSRASGPGPNVLPQQRHAQLDSELMDVDPERSAGRQTTHIDRIPMHIEMDGDAETKENPSTERETVEYKRRLNTIAAHNSRLRRLKHEMLESAATGRLQRLTVPDPAAVEAGPHFDGIMSEEVGSNPTAALARPSIYVHKACSNCRHRKMSCDGERPICRRCRLHLPRSQAPCKYSHTPASSSIPAAVDAIRTPPPVPRHTLPLACKNCRARKIKCNGTNTSDPCQNCVRRGDSCTFDVPKGESGPVVRLTEERSPGTQLSSMPPKVGIETLSTSKKDSDSIASFYESADGGFVDYLSADELETEISAALTRLAKSSATDSEYRRAAFL